MSRGRRTYPSVDAQLVGIAHYLQTFATDKRRPSEAAMEVTAMSASHRRQWWKALTAHGCLEYRADSEHGARWVAIKALP